MKYCAYCAELVCFEGALYKARRSAINRCSHVHGCHCDCYRHRVVALHVATTCHYAMVIAITMSTVRVAAAMWCLRSKQVRPAFHVMLSTCLTGIDMLSMYVES